VDYSLFNNNPIDLSLSPVGTFTPIPERHYLHLETTRVLSDRQAAPGPVSPLVQSPYASTLGRLSEHCEDEDPSRRVLNSVRDVKRGTPGLRRARTSAVTTSHPPRKSSLLPVAGSTSAYAATMQTLAQIQTYTQPHPSNLLARRNARDRPTAHLTLTSTTLARRSRSGRAHCPLIWLEEEQVWIMEDDFEDAGIPQTAPLHHTPPFGWDRPGGRRGRSADRMEALAAESDPRHSTSSPVRSQFLTLIQPRPNQRSISLNATHVLEHPTFLPSSYPPRRRSEDEFFSPPIMHPNPYNLSPAYVRRSRDGPLATEEDAIWFSEQQNRAVQRRDQDRFSPLLQEALTGIDLVGIGGRWAGGHGARSASSTSNGSQESLVSHGSASSSTSTSTNQGEEQAVAGSASAVGRRGLATNATPSTSRLRTKGRATARSKSLALQLRRTVSEGEEWDATSPPPKTPKSSKQRTGKARHARRISTGAPTSAKPPSCSPLTPSVPLLPSIQPPAEPNTKPAAESETAEEEARRFRARVSTVFDPVYPQVEASAQDLIEAAPRPRSPHRFPAHGELDASMIAAASHAENLAHLRRLEAKPMEKGMGIGMEKEEMRVSMMPRALNPWNEARNESRDAGAAGSRFHAPATQLRTAPPAQAAMPSMPSIPSALQRRSPAGVYDLDVRRKPLATPLATAYAAYKKPGAQPGARPTSDGGARPTSSGRPAAGGTSPGPSSPSGSGSGSGSGRKVTGLRKASSAGVSAHSGGEGSVGGSEGAGRGEGTVSPVSAKAVSPVTPGAGAGQGGHQRAGSVLSPL